MAGISAKLLMLALVNDPIVTAKCGRFGRILLA